MKPTKADRLSRREFLSLGLLGFASAGLVGFRDRLPPGDAPPLHGYGRITWDWLPVREQPSYRAEIVSRRYRDQVIPLLEAVTGPDGPSYNPGWYRIVGGYIFSGYVQPVRYDFNPIVRTLPKALSLAEITVPFSDSFRYTRSAGWQPLYRLYYQSTHWVSGQDEGPDGTAWYEITDDRNSQKYHVPAEHVRFITEEELAPISPGLAPEDKTIEISIENQKLAAFEKGVPVFEAPVATGVENVGEPENGIPTDTPFGAFRVRRKMPVRHMGNGDLVSNITNYELPGVPWVSFFVGTGVAIHGAYWHNNFGRRMSHGCVNMRPDDAKWIYRWTMPHGGVDDWVVDDPGTRITVV